MIKPFLPKALEELRSRGNQYFYINNRSNNVKGVARSDAPKDNYHPTLQFLCYHSSAKMPRETLCVLPAQRQTKLAAGE